DTMSKPLIKRSVTPRAKPQMPAGRRRNQRQRHPDFAANHHHTVPLIPRLSDLPFTQNDARPPTRAAPPAKVSQIPSALSGDRTPRFFISPFDSTLIFPLLKKV